MDFFTKMFLFLSLVSSVSSEPLNRIELPPGTVQTVFNQTRRILRGKDVGDTRPYMVYLRPASTAVALIDQEWTCGGAIIDERYILTSAACIEDAKHFYVISGTHRWVSPRITDDDCINNGQKKAIWKCVPRSYVYDGNDFDNIRWMINDIAVVKVEDDFNFSRKIKGCDYIPKKVGYNNKTADFEKPGTLGSIAGWGSTSVFSDIILWQMQEAKVQRSVQTNNSPELLETEVVLLNKRNCKKRWNERYHWIIDNYMICGKDGMDTDAMSSACGSEVNCKELQYSQSTSDEVRRAGVLAPDPSDAEAVNVGANRRNKPISGGFCENDHGGPLIVGHGKTAMIVGVISASQVKPKNNICYGPFLYTSVWNNRHLISCAIDKEMGSTCRRLLRASRTAMYETFFTWKAHPDGPAKGEENDEQTTRIYNNQTKKVFIDVTTKKPS